MSQVLMRPMNRKGKIGDFVLKCLRIVGVPNDVRVKAALKMGYRILEFVPNPLLSYPRNMPCPCKSGNKFKRCCLGRLPATIPSFEVEPIREQLCKIKRMRAEGNC